jgi:hypothetical protein
MVYRTRSPGGKRAPASNAGFSDPPQRRPLLPGPRRSARLLPTGHPAQGARARGPATGDLCPESRRPPRYARRRLTTARLARADLCLRSGSGARPDGTGRSTKGNAHGDDRLRRTGPLPFAPMPTGISNKDLKIEDIAVTLRLAPMASIDTAQRSCGTLA